MKSHFDKVEKVKRAILAYALKKRHQKMEVNSIMVQRHLRGFICWKNVRHELMATRELHWLEMLEQRIKKANDTERDRMDQAATKI